MMAVQDSVSAGSALGDPRVIAGAFQAIGSIVAAMLVVMAGGVISRKYSRERDAQDKESQWRAHAVELAKLDLNRKLEIRKTSPGTTPETSANSGSLTTSPRIRPSILDFLANYRDLKELDFLTPKELYRKIWDQRINGIGASETSDPQQLELFSVEQNSTKDSLQKEMVLLLLLARERLGWHRRSYHRTSEIGGIYNADASVVRRLECILKQIAP